MRRLFSVLAVTALIAAMGILAGPASADPYYGPSWDLPPEEQLNCDHLVLTPGNPDEPWFWTNPNNDCALIR